MTDNQIPAPVIAEVARSFDAEYTHAYIDNLFIRAGAPGEPPAGSKLVKVAAWLRQINAEADDPLAVLGRLLEEFMETRPSWYLEERDDLIGPFRQRRQRIQDALAARGLSYHTGGKILGGTPLPLDTFIVVLRSVCSVPPPSCPPMSVQAVSS